MSGLDARALELEKLPRHPAPQLRHSFRVIVSEAAFDRATSRGVAEPTREVGGVLVGRVCCDDSGPYVLVEDTIDALHADEKETELTFTHATWEHVHKEMDSVHKDKQIVGWYHTHPGFGIFLSDRDLFIQQSFFNLPYQIALVFDPESREHGVFVWRDNRAVRARRYWIGETEQVWEEPPSKPAEQPRAPERNKPRPVVERPPAEAAVGWDLATLGMAGLALLMLGFLGGWWLRGSRGDKLVERAEVEIARAQVMGAQRVASALNAELLALLRQSLDGAAVRRTLETGLVPLENGMADLSAGKDPQRALAQIALGRDNVRRFLESYASAEAKLAELELAASGGGPRSDALPAAVGQLYYELADEAHAAGDTRRLRRLLATATAIDPGNAERYSNRLRELLGEESP